MIESTRRTPKEQGSKGFNLSISYILLGKTEALAPTSHKEKQEKLFNLILTIGSQPYSSFLGIETSSLPYPCPRALFSMSPPPGRLAGAPPPCRRHPAPPCPCDSVSSPPARSDGPASH